MTEGPTNPQRLNWTYGCPFCGSPVRLLADTCGNCSLPLQDERALQVATLDAAIVDTQRHRSRLLGQRNGLLGQHVPPILWGDAMAPQGVPQGGQLGGQLGVPQAPFPRGEVRRRDVQATLLGLGGVLIALAALVFAAVTWQRSGPAAQVTILLAVTALALGSAWPLISRGMTDTAQTMALVGCAMVAVDALLMRHLVAPGLDARSFWAATALLLTALYVGYGVVTGLSAPHTLAAVTGQAPLLLIAARVAHSASSAALLVAATVALDGLAVWFLRDSDSRLSTARHVAAAAGSGLWCLGVGAVILATLDNWGALHSVVTDTLALLAFAAIMAGFAQLSSRWPEAAATGAALVAMTAVLTAGLRGLHVSSQLGIATGLAIVGVVALAVAVASSPLFSGGLHGAASISIVAGVATLAPLVASAVRHQVEYGRTDRLSLGFSACLASSILLLAASGLVVTRGTLGSLRMWPAVAAATVAALVASLPLFVDGSSVAFATVTFAAGSAMVGVVLALRGHPAASETPAAAAFFTGVVSILYAALLVGTHLTQVAFVLGLATALIASSAVVGVQRPASVGIAILAAGGALAASWSAWGHPLVPTAVAVLLVPIVVAVALAADPSRADRPSMAPVVVAAEGAATAVAVVSVGFAFQAGLSWFGWALCVTGLGVLVQCVRPTRSDAWYGGVALLTLSSWIHLWLHDVATVEAYSVPVSLVVLGIGAVRRRQNGAMSSTAAYATGLSGALVPSLLSGFTSVGTTRSVLVLIAAAGVALIGARFRLLAPLAIGATVALVDAAWIAAPHVAALPRWMSLGSVGLVLLFVGATYERRRQQALEVAERVRSLA